MDLILYHGNCPDGWAAAYICKRKYPKAELVPLNHGLGVGPLQVIMEQCAGKNVLMVDYSLPTRELNDQLNSVAKSFRILDHHKSAREVLQGADYAVFDMKRSGAGLTWDYLFGTDSNVVDIHGTKRPWWVDYTEDQDLWNWALPSSQEINAYLMVQERSMELWNEITKMSVSSAVTLGKGVRQYIEYYTRSVVAEAQSGVLFFQTDTIESEDETIILPVYTSYNTAVVNIPYVGVSEAGAALVESGFEIGLAWFERGDGLTQFSLRSAKGGPIDVSAIAKRYGGGGHQSAAGFQVSLREGREIVDQILGRLSYEKSN
jgi:uncharacterized protein